MSLIGSSKPQAIVEPMADAGPEIAAAIAAAAERPNAAILDTCSSSAPTRRFTVFGFEPVSCVSVGAGTRAPILSAVLNGLGELPCAGDHSPLPFAGGWIGYVTYEAGLPLIGIEPRRVAAPSLPNVRFCLYDTVAVFDHGERQWYLTGIDWGLAPSRRSRPLRERLTRLRGWLDAAARRQNYDPARRTDPPLLVSSLPRAEYHRRIERIKRYIAAGDVYQVNLTQRFEADVATSPVELYLRLREATPSPYAAFLSWDGAAVLSASPELFLEFRQGRVLSRPIKGTRPRGADDRSDAALRRALAASQKDRAELNMIVDLVRNDLGRVCALGSVRVTDAGSIESHPNVHHRVATVEGELAADRRWQDAFVSLFPGGSVTGAPKIRAMQIIDELEPVPRGVYCGVIGYVGMDGSACFNLAIRTMTMHGGTVYAHAGGGVVADSEPEAEYEEMLAKASGMLNAIGYDGRDAPAALESCAT